MQALPGEVVWLRFSSFLAGHHKSPLYRADLCTNTLSLTDGPPFLSSNNSLIGPHHLISQQFLFFCIKQTYSLWHVLFLV